MSCQSSKGAGDSLEVVRGPSLFGASATGWLLGEAVRHLNSTDQEGALSYQRVVELLRRCSKDLLETVGGLFRQERSGGAGVRWNLLYVLGDAADAGAAEFLVSAALEKLPEANPDHGCEGPRDVEMLVSTMAIQALHRIAGRHPEASEALLKIVAAQPARPLLVEAVKAATELGLKDKVREILPEDSRWILEIRRVRIGEVFADPEREDGKERGFTPPRTGALYTAPRVGCCTAKEK